MTNQDAFRRLIGVINSGDLSSWNELIAADFKEHLEAPEVERGREGFRAFVVKLRRAFPDLHVTIEDLVGSGDRVCARVTIRGTQRGEIGGIPPTGRKLAVQLAEIMRFVDGKCAERWGVLDGLMLVRQLM